MTERIWRSMRQVLFKCLRKICILRLYNMHVEVKGGTGRTVRASGYMKEDMEAGRHPVPDEGFEKDIREVWNELRNVR